MRKLIIALALVALAGCSGGESATTGSSGSNANGGTDGSAATTQGSSGTSSDNGSTASSSSTSSSSSGGPTSTSSSSTSTSTGTSSSSSSSSSGTTATSSSSSSGTTGTSSSSSSSSTGQTTAGTSGASGPGAGLFFSEYVESSSNKALELYNNSIDDPLDLSQFAIQLYSNQTATVSATLNLTGSVAQGQTFVICKSSSGSTIPAADCNLITTSTAMNFNGDDSIRLVRKSDGAQIDRFGGGTYPGSAGWSANGVVTKDTTLRRKCSVGTGDTTWTDFDPSIEWLAYTVDTFCDLGAACGATATCTQTTTGGSTTGGSTTGGSTTGGSTTGGSTTGSTGCSNPCTLNAVQCKDSGHVEKCEVVSGCNQWVVTTNCGVNQACQNGACVDTGCGGGCDTPPGSICEDPNTQVTYSVPGTCNNNQCSYASAETACAYGCNNGLCAAQPTCTSGSARCNGNQVETCNANGTAWLFTENCPSTCTNGLCDAPCTPGATRCNGSTAETCNSAGTAWQSTSTCPNGCAQGQCLQNSLTVDGTTQLMDGEYHFSGTVDVKNGGTIQLDPNGAYHRLTIYAQEIDVELSSTITGADVVGGCASIYVGPDDIHFGIRLYANVVKIDGTVSFTGTSCAKNGLVIRADTINGSGSVSSSERDLLLYGTGGLATGLSTPGTPSKSLMPPTQITSATYPAGGTYNDDGPPASFSWDKPYSTVAGYYYEIGSSSQVPSSAGSTLLYAEALGTNAAPAVGTTYLDVVTLDSNGNVGTVPHEFPIHVVDLPPVLSSTTDTQGQYTTNTAVTMQWSGGNASVGYYYVFDHFPTTRPTPQTGTYKAANSSQLLMTNVAPGRWWFHMIAADTMGYLTKGASHFEVDIGTQPSNGTLDGTVTDSSGNRLASATIVVQRGLYTTTTDSNGIYDFNASIPAGTYEVVAEKAGFQSAAQTLTVTAGATTNGDFALTAGNGCPSCSDTCAGIADVNVANSCSSNTQSDPPLWNGTCYHGAIVNEFNPANGSTQSCSWGCNGAVCSDGSNGSPCTSSGQCISSYCESNGFCGSSSCEAGYRAYCGYNYAAYACCYPYSCSYDSTYGEYTCR